MSVRHVADFVAHARERLPGVVYGFNLASFKRRNMHLGHLVGDVDIAELDRLLRALPAVVKRTHGDRWLVLAPPDLAVAPVLERFARADPFDVGWEVTATKDGDVLVNREVVRTTVMRAARCIFAPVTTPAELDAAVEGILANDYSLPVGRPVALDSIASLERKEWSCVSLYPERSPACPFCGGRELDDADADGSVYTADGTCRGCGATIAVRGVTRALA